MLKKCSVSRGGVALLLCEGLSVQGFLQKQVLLIRKLYTPHHLSTFPETSFVPVHLKCLPFVENSWKQKESRASQDKGIECFVHMERLRNARVKVYENFSLGLQNILNVQYISFSWVSFSNEH